ncbi:MocR-like pyridoxine biosynthesis transcription factor PdxR [Streptomyces sp. NPDC004561]
MSANGFHVSLEGRGDLTTRIYQALLAGIRDGRLRPGDRLPPTRTFARSLEVSRNTVAAAYERLTADGFLVARVGDGTFVAAEAPLAQRDREPTAAAIRPRADWTSTPTPTSSQQDVPRYDFRVGIPDASLFPFGTWRRLVTSELRLKANSPGLYAEPSGHPQLREAVSRYTGLSRSVRSGPDDVLITNGAQQAFDLIGRVLITPGDIVAVEEPGYPPARDLFASLGARVTGVPVDAEGLVVDRLPPTAQLIYTTPSHQFPLGTSMSLARRAALLSWARERDAVIIEDDYDSEFRFSRRPLEPLQSLDTAGRVLYVGTFSKTMLPGVRIGFIVAPPTLRSALRAAKQLSDGYGQIASQAALARFINEGHLAQHIRKAARAYQYRHDTIIRIVEQDFADQLQLLPSSAGLHVCARLCSGDPTVPLAVAAAARECGLAIEPLSHYCRTNPAQAGFVLGFGAARPDTIEEGLDRFGALLARQATGLL